MNLLDPLLDRSVVLSFDRSGFARHARSFRADDLDVDLRGRTALVTGANSGIGKATAMGLAERGAEVWLLCRSESRAEKARKEIADATLNANVHVCQVDLSSLSSVRSAMESIPCPRVDLLIHNAGVLPGERILTDEGLELTLATNLVGPFLMSRLLLERLARSPDARIIHVSSGGMYSKRLVVDELASTEGAFDGVDAYARTKRALVVLTELMTERLSNTLLTAHSMHPGWADTPAVRSSLPMFHRVTRAILRDAKQGADTVLWLAMADPPRLRPGRFWFDREERRTHFTRFTKERPRERERLWSQLSLWAGLDPDERWDYAAQSGARKSSAIAEEQDHG